MYVQIRAGQAAQAQAVSEGGWHHLRNPKDEEIVPACHGMGAGTAKVEGK